MREINTNQFNYFIKQDESDIDYSQAHKEAFTAWDKDNSAVSYSLISLFADPLGYNNVCTDRSSQLQFDYVSKRQTSFSRDGDKISIFYPISYDESDDNDLIDLVNDFLSKLHFNYEVGYQEETCQEKLATLDTWGQWGDCLDENDKAVEYGKGVHKRTRGCSYKSGASSVEFENSSGVWRPVSTAGWESVTGVVFNELDCHCKGEINDEKPCLKPCKYEQWSTWLTWEISDSDVSTRRTASKMCVPQNQKAGGKDFYDYVKDTDPLDLSLGSGYDSKSFCSSNPKGELGFKVRFYFLLLTLSQNQKY